MYLLECYKPYEGRQIIIARDKKSCLDKVPKGWIVDEHINYEHLIIDKNRGVIDYKTTCEYMK